MKHEPSEYHEEVHYISQVYFGNTKQYTTLDLFDNNIWHGAWITSRRLSRFPGSRADDVDVVRALRSCASAESGFFGTNVHFRWPISRLV